MPTSIGSFTATTIANDIVDMWTQYSRERDRYIARGSELRKYLTAPDTNYTEVGDNDKNYKHNTVTPKLTQIYDNLGAQYISALHPNDDWVSFEGTNPEDMVKESKVETYLRHKLKESGFIITEREVIGDWIWMGNACLGVEHVHKTTKSFTTGEEVTLYHGPKSIRISPYDYVVDPRANSFEESLFIRRRLVPRQELLKHDNSRSLWQYNKAALDSVSVVEGYQNDPTDTFKDASLNVDGFTGPREYLQSGLCEILEYWGSFYDRDTGQYHTNITIGIADRMFVLWKQDNPMWNGQRPYSFTGWRNRPDNLYSQSPLEQLVGMQYRIDHLENTKADILDQTIHPTVDVIGDITDDYETGPGVINYLGNEGKTIWNRPDASALQLNTEIYNLMNLMEEMAGAPKQTAGFRTPGEKTAFEVDQLQEGAMKMFLEKTKHWESTMLKHHLSNFYCVLAMNFSVEDTYRVLDSDTDALEIVAVTKEDVIRDGNFKLKGSENYAKRNKLMLDLRDGLGLLLSSETTAMHVDGLAIDKMVSRELDWEKYGIIKEFAGITNQIDAQLAMQLHQQEMEKMMGQEVQSADTEAPPR